MLIFKGATISILFVLSENGNYLTSSGFFPIGVTTMRDAGGLEGLATRRGTVPGGTGHRDSGAWVYGCAQAGW